MPPKPRPDASGETSPVDQPAAPDASSERAEPETGPVVDESLPVDQPPPVDPTLPAAAPAEPDALSESAEPETGPVVDELERRVEARWISGQPAVVLDRATGRRRLVRYGDVIVVRADQLAGRNVIAADDPFEPDPELAATNPDRFTPAEES